MIWKSPTMVTKGKFNPIQTYVDTSQITVLFTTDSEVSTEQVFIIYKNENIKCT